MAHAKSILFFTAWLLLGAMPLSLLSMEPYDPSEKNSPKITAKINAALTHSQSALQEAELLIQKAENVLARSNESQDHAHDTPVISYSPSPEPMPSNPMPAPNHLMPNLAAQLDNFFEIEEINTNFLGEETNVALPASVPTPASPPIAHIVPTPAAAAAAEVRQESAATENNPPQVPAPFIAMPGIPAVSQHAVHKIDESFLADILKNIPEAKGPMIAAGALGMVHYLYENQVFNQAIGVRSPRMKEYLHKYILPTAREALAAHLIQLLLPLLPYLKDNNIRSYSTANYLGSYVTTKILGTTTLYLATLMTKTEQGKKLVTHYKRLPKKTKETIEKVAPWLDFIRNMFMARSLANYME